MVSLPEKVKVKGAVIPAGKDKASIEMQADADMRETTVQAKVIAQVGEVRADQPFALQIIASFRLLPIEAVTLKPGETRKVEFRVERDGYNGSIDVEVAELPEGVRIPSVCWPPSPDW